MAEGTEPRPFNMILSEVSITTDSKGLGYSQYNRNDYTVISATTGGQPVIPFVQTFSEGGKIGVILLDKDSFRPFPNATITVTFCLMPK